ncbi:PilZ domain protein [bacterium BMS3Bbin12]|nr:PilZ domain protein [bacterium BMS3Abin12]GBE48994.1 PilZ domain protein [bacterium BMS3Bbin12]GBE49325.1 PilZ domain protein [bacterium BMS3Bbin13]
MEQRLTERHPAALEVLVYRNKVPVLTGVTRNVGTSGMFISTSAPNELPERSFVEVEFDLEDNDEVRKCRVPGWVARRLGEGIGVTFMTLDSRGRRDLQRLLRRTGGRLPQWRPELPPRGAL